MDLWFGKQVYTTVMHRFYTSQSLHLGEISIESLQITHQLAKVLRIKPGEAVIFFNDSHFDFYAEIILYAKESVRVRITKKEKNNRELSLKITLCFALIKKERMEWLLEKGTEIGIHEFVPIITKRTVLKELAFERSRKIIKEAAEQSGRAYLPMLLETMPLSEALTACKKAKAAGIFLHPEEKTGASLSKCFAESSKASAVWMFVGPEGGFTDEEVLCAREAGVLVASPYPTILRAETAGIVFPALIAALGEQDSKKKE